MLILHRVVYQVKLWRAEGNGYRELGAEKGKDAADFFWLADCRELDGIDGLPSVNVNLGGDYSGGGGTDFYCFYYSAPFVLF